MSTLVRDKKILLPDKLIFSLLAQTDKLKFEDKNIRKYKLGNLIFNRAS